ncbi:MAG: class I SAM-dependent RNA methyltransferase [Bdellovibrionaceae bacterium]|jgi:23S rRNA (uracil1939-C5)-methyltransferase|nr:class I SAM-dependent RNA methyltransferase [Pseudobdellovibrionaceae bacterium]
MDKPQLNEEIDLRIDRISFHGGRGVGRYNNFVIFVPFTAPEDFVTVQIVEVKKKFAIAKLIKIIEPSPFRVAPACKYYELCGGCSLQHINYKKQIEEKEAILKKTLLGIQRYDLAHFEGVQASKKDYYYRNRIKLKVKNGQYGYFQNATHKFIPIEQCIIADEKLNEKIKSHPAGKSLKEKEFYLYSQEGYFTQVNDEQNLWLQELVLGIVQKNNYIEIYDFYCGSGNFTFPLAETNNNSLIVGVENSQEAINYAIKKSKEDGLTNIQFLCSDVAKSLNAITSIEKAFFLFDPPRSGLNTKIIQKTLKLNPQTILYISCNPTTMVRDINELMSLNNNYRITLTGGLDMFPQTSHIESYILLEQHS